SRFEVGLEAGEDHRPAAVELLVRVLAKVVVGHGEAARVADRFDLPGDARRSLALHVLAPERSHTLHEAARGIDLKILAFHQRPVVGGVTCLVPRARRPVRVDMDPEVVFASDLAVGNGLPQALRSCLDVDLENFLHACLQFVFSSLSPAVHGSAYLLTHRSWTSRIGTGLRKWSFSRPRRLVTTRPASSSCFRCFMTPNRVIRNRAWSAPNVCPSSRKSRSRRLRRVGSANALNTSSTAANYR